MKNDTTGTGSRDELKKPVPNEAAPDRKKLGSVDIVIKEIEISRPARSVNRIWPNR